MSKIEKYGRYKVPLNMGRTILQGCRVINSPTISLVGLFITRNSMAFPLRSPNKDPDAKTDTGHEDSERHVINYSYNKKISGQ